MLVHLFVNVPMLCAFGVLDLQINLNNLLLQIMASSLNGLTVGDPLPDNLMDSPVRSEIMMPYLR